MEDYMIKIVYSNGHRPVVIPVNSLVEGFVKAENEIARDCDVKKVHISVKCENDVAGSYVEFIFYSNGEVKIR